LIYVFVQYHFLFASFIETGPSFCAAVLFVFQNDFGSTYDSMQRSLYLAVMSRTSSNNFSSSSVGSRPRLRNF